MSELTLIRPDWPAPPSVQAAVSTRTGGVSLAPYDSLNLGGHVGDQAARVAENRRRLRSALALDSDPVWLQQEHGTTVARPAESPSHPSLTARSPSIRRRYAPS
jgi:copper oxidase (laccase) domain-containing protein